MRTYSHRALLTGMTVLVIALQSGCGTFASLCFPSGNPDKSLLYSGVRRWYKDPGEGTRCLPPLFPFDLALSAVVDTALLPITLVYEIFRPAGAPTPTMKTRPGPSVPREALPRGQTWSKLPSWGVGVRPPSGWRRF